MALAPLLLTCVAMSVARAGEYYVSPAGSEQDDGSRGSPWPSVEHALDQVGGGHTVVMLPGLYRGPVTIPAHCSGTRERPTVIKSQTKWAAAVMGAETYAVLADNDCDWIVIDGLEVFGARRDGIKILGDYGVVRNCWVHNNAHMGISSFGREGVLIERNLVEYNGSHVQFHHGLYVNGARHEIAASIVRHNAGWGLHLYAEITDSVIANNLVYGHAHRPGAIVQSPETGGRNVIVNNTLARNGGGIDIVSGSANVLANNILIHQFDPIGLHDTSDPVIDHNLCLPGSSHQGPNGIAADPRFVDPDKGVFWLAEGSPAADTGSSRHARTTDFWGSPRGDGLAHHIGCFPFRTSLTAEAARTGWYHEWPYQFYPNEQMGLPDLWQPPADST